MRDAQRIKRILSLVEQVWSDYPDLRLGQLIVNMSPKYNLFYIEDDELEASLIEWLNVHQKK